MAIINTTINDISAQISSFITDLDIVDKQIANRSRFRDIFFDMYSCRNREKKEKFQCVRDKLVSKCPKINLDQASSAELVLYGMCLKQSSNQIRLATLLDM